MTGCQSVTARLMARCNQQGNAGIDTNSGLGMLSKKKKARDSGREVSSWRGASHVSMTSSEKKLVSKSTLHLDLIAFIEQWTLLFYIFSSSEYSRLYSSLAMLQLQCSLRSFSKYYSLRSKINTHYGSR
jgi:predicted YcjX-like family ATPase